MELTRAPTCDLRIFPVEQESYSDVRELYCNLKVFSASQLSLSASAVISLQYDVVPSKVVAPHTDSHRECVPKIACRNTRSNKSIKYTPGRIFVITSIWRRRREGRLSVASE